MRRGICPKCRTTAIHIAPETATSHGGMLQISLSSQARLITLVCSNCGYLEQYLPNAASRQLIAEQWPVYEPLAGAAQPRPRRDANPPAQRGSGVGPGLLLQRPRLDPDERAARQRHAMLWTAGAALVVSLLFGLLLTLLLAAPQ